MVKMDKQNLYANTAELYDFDNRALLNEDLELCLECVRETSGDILEIACGTGRITIPVLENAAGRKVTAFDLSEDMLSVFRKKALPPEFAGNLQIARADMRDFSFDKKFGLTILIWRAFQVLLNREDAVKCLRNVKKHMGSGGVFLFSVFLPQKSYGGDWPGRETLAYETVDPATNNRIRRRTKNLRADEGAQIIEYASIYDIVTPAGARKTLEDMITYRYYHPEQIKALLKDCGFAVVRESASETDMFFILKSAA